MVQCDDREIIFTLIGAVSGCKIAMNSMTVLRSIPCPHSLYILIALMFWIFNNFALSIRVLGQITVANDVLLFCNQNTGI